MFALSHMSRICGVGTRFSFNSRPATMYTLPASVGPRTSSRAPSTARESHRIGDREHVRVRAADLRQRRRLRSRIEDIELVAAKQRKAGAGGRARSRAARARTLHRAGRAPPGGRPALRIPEPRGPDDAPQARRSALRGHARMQAAKGCAPSMISSSVSAASAKRSRLPGEAPRFEASRREHRSYPLPLCWSRDDERRPQRRPGCCSLLASSRRSRRSRSLR